MDPMVYRHLSDRPELIHFIRQNPIWYRYLTRDPKKVSEMEKEAKRYFGKTFPQQLEKIGNNVQMLNMLIHFAGAMKD